MADGFIYKINITLTVASFYTCEEVLNPHVSVELPIWKQTEVGCQMLMVLQNIYGFNITYAREYLESNVTEAYDSVNRSHHWNHDVDIYLRPISFGIDRLDFMYPVYSAYMKKYGFLLRLSENGLYRTFYSKPFSRPAWSCLYVMAFFISVLFYILKRWEFKVIGGWRCSYPYEILLVIGAYCQHIPPMEATLPSRRIAYFVFFMFAYVVYTFYTSNLLSHLVNDKQHTISLETLATTDIECVVVDYMMLTLAENVPPYSRNYGVLVQKLHALRSVTLTEGIEGLKAGKMALLSDYTSLLPIVKKFSDHEICGLSTIDLFSNIKKYVFTAKDFPYKEHFKIGSLRAKETGVLKRLKIKQDMPICTLSNIVETKLVQISTPMLVLFGTYIVSIFILLIERNHYRRHKVWPYVN